MTTESARDSSTKTEKPPHIVMYLNGQPIYSRDSPTGPISDTEVQQLVELVTGQPEVAAAWMERPNPRLNNRTPRQAILDGEVQDAADILRSFMAL